MHVIDASPQFRAIIGTAPAKSSRFAASTSPTKRTAVAGLLASELHARLEKVTLIVRVILDSRDLFALPAFNFHSCVVVSSLLSLRSSAWTPPAYRDQLGRCWHDHIQQPYKQHVLSYANSTSRLLCFV